MMDSRVLDFIRSSASVEGNFHLQFPELPEEFRERFSPDSDGSNKQIRDFVIERVIHPLIDAADRVEIHQGIFFENSFNSEGADLLKILKKKRAGFEVLDQDKIIKELRCFWSGYDCVDSTVSRGYVVFYFKCVNFDCTRIFESCFRLGVLSASSFRTKISLSIYKKVVGFLNDNFFGCVIVLGHRSSLSSITVFPGNSVFKMMIESAIVSARSS